MLAERMERDFNPPHPQFIGLAFRDKRNPVKEKNGTGDDVLSSRGKLEGVGGERGKRALSESGLLSGEKCTDFD